MKKLICLLLVFVIAIGLFGCSKSNNELFTDEFFEDVVSIGYFGEETVSGESFRDTYDLASSCFELQEFEANTRAVTKGLGHGLGLSQHTANEMAKEGKNYKEILAYFFEGTEVKEVAEILWDTE